MLKNNIVLIGIFCFFSVTSIRGQERDSTSLATQQVTVVKSYNPSLSDVFQIKTNPEIPDSIATQKRPLNYAILSIPVMETFEPNKANPLELIRTAPEKPYNTLLGFGYGSKGQLYLDLSTTIAIDREQQFGAMLYHDGFRGNVNNTLLESNQSHLFLGVQHALKNNNFRGDSKLSYNRAGYNYFGLYDRNWDALLLNSIQPEIIRNYVQINSRWQWYDGVLQEMDFKSDITTDNYQTNEQTLLLLVKAGVPLFEGELAIGAEVAGVASSFKESYFDNTAKSYQNGKGSLEVAWKQIENELKIKVGAGVSYVLVDNLQGTALQYYPKIALSYQANKAKVIPYLNANGATTLGNYTTFSIQNPFLAPVVDLQPLWQKYNARVGVRHSQANVLSFNFSLGYDQLENLSLFKRLPYDPAHNNRAYRLSNAFEVRYVNATRYDFRAQLGFDFARQNHLDFEIQYLSYQTPDQSVLWNIPQLKLGSNGQFNWANLSFVFNTEVVGERTAALLPVFNTLEIDPNRVSDKEKLPLYMQTTLGLNYKIKEPFDVFVKGRFTNSATHGLWGYYPQPSYLFLAGIRYKMNR